MESKELRIGNYLKNPRGKYFEVTSNDILIISEYESKAEPIELTEEILLSCGFKAKNEYDDFVFNGIKIQSTIIRCNTKERSCFFLYLGEENESLNIRIKHLHQLQNLYWCLTNEELEINL